jgi:anti-sigma B factor antagonist
MGNDARTADSPCPICGSDLENEPSSTPGDMACPRCGYRQWFAWDERGDEQIITPSVAMLPGESVGKLCASFAPRPDAHVVIDLSRVQFVASEALARLITFKQKVRAENGRLTLRGMSSSLLEVFRICRLDQVFELE